MGLTLQLLAGALLAVVAGRVGDWIRSVHAAQDSAGDVQAEVEENSLRLFRWWGEIGASISRAHAIVVRVEGPPRELADAIHSAWGRGDIGDTLACINAFNSLLGYDSYWTEAATIKPLTVPEAPKMERSAWNAARSRFVRHGTPEEMKALKSFYVLVSLQWESITREALKDGEREALRALEAIQRRGVRRLLLRPARWLLDLRWELPARG